MRLVRALPVLAALLTSCTRDGDEQPFVFAECPMPGQFVLEGELDGRPIAINQPSDGYGFANALGEPGYLEVYANTEADACEVDEDCPADSACVGLLCIIDPQMCVTAPDCGPGTPCIDGLCYKVPRVRVTFPDLIAYGDEAVARGTAELEGLGVVAGNCDADEYSGIIKQSADGSTFSFVLRDLKVAPFCGGAAIAGELRGCVQK